MTNDIVNVENTAIALVNGDRQASYGKPIDDFSRTAGMMSAIGFRFSDPSTNTLRLIEAKDIPIFMMLIKLSREVHKHKDDNLIDICGYVKTLESVLADTILEMPSN